MGENEPGASLCPVEIVKKEECDESGRKTARPDEPG